MITLLDSVTGFVFATTHPRGDSAHLLSLSQLCHMVTSESRCSVASFPRNRAVECASAASSKTAVCSEGGGQVTWCGCDNVKLSDGSSLPPHTTHRVTHTPKAGSIQVRRTSSPSVTDSNDVDTNCSTFPKVLSDRPPQDAMRLSPPISVGLSISWADQITQIRASGKANAGQDSRSHHLASSIDAS